MGVLRTPLPVKLFFGMLSPDQALFDVCENILRDEFGPLEFVSEIFSWDRTDYYRAEMGTGLVRKFLFFQTVMAPGTLSGVKRFAVGLEQKFAVPGEHGLQRRINLDPGYVTEAKVVLASTKDFAHRVYIGNEIYAEVTLRYSARERRFIPHELTYPDFGTEEYIRLFNRARKSLREAIQKVAGRQRG